MFKILQKELRTLFKDRRALILGLLMPIILISIFSLAFGGMNKGNNKKTQLLVCDEDKTEFTKKLVVAIDSIKTIDMATTTLDTALDLVKNGKYPGVFIFHKGFTDSAHASKPLPWEMKSDATRSIEMEMMQQYLVQTLYSKVALMSMQNQAGNADDLSAAIAMQQMKKSMDERSKMQENMKIQSSSIATGPNNDGLVQAVAGTAVMMLLFSLTAMGGRLLEEKENGTLKRLLYSPLTASDILMGKMLSSILFATVQLIIMFSFSSMVFGLVLAPKIVAVLLLILVTAFACSGFGMFLASVVKSRDQLQTLSTLAILSMSVIGGSMVPSFLMPGWMQIVGHASINYWSIQGFYDIFSRQLALTDFIFLKKVLVLFLFGAVLSTMAFRLFRKNVTSMA
ncbi:MAG TPA: ABC transporter permease [Bacteroidia bacterium]|jgi:ABC-2 type transport system permease protein|nr:ABC transporter permease [Bacteroidia bacterium]